MIVNNTIINNGVDTSDATATEENIDYGYTAYVNGEKIVGSSLKVDTSADTVTEDVLLEGYTAHDSSGNPIVGYYIPPSLLDARVDASSSYVTNLTVDVRNMNDRLMNITLTFDVESEGFHISNCMIDLTVLI